MIWVGWRQQRTETVIAAALLTLLALVLIPTGLQIAHAYDRDGIAQCVGAQPSAGACGVALDAFKTRFASIGNLTAWMTIIPGVLGLLLATPFVVELERRTCRLDWTQSITRRRWIVTKLGLAALTALLAAALLTALITWWRAPFVHLQGRLDNSVFDAEGTVVSAYTLFALGLGAAVGAVWRRVGPSLIVAFGGYFGARLFVDLWLRERLAPAVHTTFAPTHAPNLDHAWITEQYVTDRAGHRLTDYVCAHGAGGACRVPVRDGVIHATFHPASHFWTLQLRETALFGLLALALLGFAAWWTHTRAA